MVDIRGQPCRLVLLDLAAGGECRLLCLDLLRLGDQPLVGAGAVVQLISEQTFQPFEGIGKSLLRDLACINGGEELLQSCGNFI